MMAPLLQPRELHADESYQVSLAYGLIIGPAVLSLLVCVLRLYTRAVVVKMFGLDDIAVSLALFITQVFNGLGIAVVYYGEGRHIQNVSPEHLATWLKLYYVAMCMYLYVSCSVKVSLLLFLRRIFVKRWMQNLTLGLIIFQVLFAVSGSFVLAFQCTPARAAFDLTIQNPKCMSRFKLFQVTLYQAVLMFTSDIVILIAPLPILYCLKMPRRKVVALMFIFGSGLIACIAPVVRFSTLDYLHNGSTDLTFDSTSSLYWMAIEFNLGLVAGSLSSLRPLPFFRRFGSSYNSKKSSRSETPKGFVRMNNLDQNGKKKGLGMGTTLLQETITYESQEHIVQDTTTMK
ncbi:hypothetical protein BDV25DRAFT_152796 [Aspergillus avenaceus]|uniref:Rhodopsin domain-containing protein n=1 Tax=Aspergillus avenaceus TaxID=36643 RepID=A0A5N6TYD2_ASPAV|nr:hypothetical protein BDV25DRAFT_152796 [Aspergillus avenaceus]